MNEKKGCACGDPIVTGLHGPDVCEPYKEEGGGSLEDLLLLVEQAFPVYFQDRDGCDPFKDWIERAEVALKANGVEPKHWGV